jgi:hypothetical protein
MKTLVSKKLLKVDQHNPYYDYYIYELEYSDGTKEEEIYTYKIGD